MKGWKASVFSMASKEVLIKSVIQSIPNYVMSVFKISVSLIREIEKLMVRFDGAAW